MAMLVTLDTFSSYNWVSAVCSAERREPLLWLLWQGRAIGSTPTGMAVLPYSSIRGQTFAFPIIFRSHRILIWFSFFLPSFLFFLVQPFRNGPYKTGSGLGLACGSWSEDPSFRLDRHGRNTPVALNQPFLLPRW